MKVESLIHCGSSISQGPFEVVEIKGRGHPDTICDLVCENVSRNLLEFYQTQCGQPLHYNVDKAYLVGGRARPRFGGGEIVEPPKLYLGDRATDTFKGKKLDLDSVVVSAVDSWLKQNLRFLRLESGLNFYSEIKPGSESLSSVEEQNVSNDTSVGVGSWPPTPLEKLIIDLEAYLNSVEFKRKHPETGEDIKIMAIRNGSEVKLIFAVAFVDRFVESVKDYFDKKTLISDRILSHLNEKNDGVRYSVEINCLDRPEHEEAGLHLTVTGLSCENGDSGQVGRGNRVNNVISFLRPQTMEAWAGKNPITHVGKIYSFAAQSLARQVVESLPEAAGANIYLVGQIGSPVSKPAYVYCDVAVPENCKVSPLNEEVNRIIVREIERGDIFRVQRVMGKV